MPFIQNIAASDVPRGLHREPGDNAMLIQISDPCGYKPDPRWPFKERYFFEFLDIEAEDECDDEEMRCSSEQGMALAKLLQRALDNDMNVVVHCYAGVSRSGAVCEVGVQMGFEDASDFRSPNILIKNLMLKALGRSYDPLEKADPEAWRNMKMM